MVRKLDISRPSSAQCLIPRHFRADSVIKTSKVGSRKGDSEKDFYLFFYSSFCPFFPFNVFVFYPRVDNDLVHETATEPSLKRNLLRNFNWFKVLSLQTWTVCVGVWYSCELGMYDFFFFNFNFLIICREISVLKIWNILFVFEV